jgi:hypothetical protein
VPGPESTHRSTSRAVDVNGCRGEPVVPRIEIGRAEHQAVALIVVFLVGIAINEKQCPLSPVSPSARP